MNKTLLITVVLIVIAFLLALLYYQQLPGEAIASHWNYQGEVDGYMSKFWGLFLMPIISLALFLLFLGIPRIDPLKKNIEKFRNYYNLFMLILIAFLLYIQILMILWNNNLTFNMTRALVPAFAVLFYFIGILTEKSKRNWFVGIRTPWTLSSIKVWEETHKTTGKLFKIVGIIALIGILFNKHAILFVIVPVTVVAIYSIIFSYFEYQKLNKHDKKRQTNNKSKKRRTKS